MDFTTTITQKGQITLPKHIREFLEVKPGTRVTIKSVDKKIKTIAINPLPKLTELAGSFKPQKTYDPVVLRRKMEEHYTRI